MYYDNNNREICTHTQNVTDSSTGGLTWSVSNGIDIDIWMGGQNNIWAKLT